MFYLTANLQYMSVFMRVAHSPASTLYLRDGQTRKIVIHTQEGASTSTPSLATRMLRSVGFFTDES